MAALHGFSTAVFQSADHGEYYFSRSFFRRDQCQVGCLDRGERGGAGEQEPGAGAKRGEVFVSSDEEDDGDSE